MARRATERADEDKVLVDDGEVQELDRTGPVAVVEAEPGRPESETSTRVMPDGPRAADPDSSAERDITGPQPLVTEPGRPGWVPPPLPPPPPPPAPGPRRAPSERPARTRRIRGPRVVQGRRSRRVVRRIDSWTVFKLSFLFYLCGGLILLIAGIALWNIAGAFDVITNVEKFVQKLFDLQSFKLRANVILAYSSVGAGVLVLLGTGANVLMALLYNLISDVIGGVQVIVLEETDTDGEPGSNRAKGRIRERAEDRLPRRRDRPQADDPALSP